MESRIKAARNWAKVKDLLIVKKNTQPKLAPISPFIRRTIRQDTECKHVEYSHSLYRWVCYEKPVNLSIESIKSANDHVVDSTGWWVWPAEELLAYYILIHNWKTSYRSVLELGAGSSGMAGICSYLKWKPGQVTITDGKLENLSSIKRTLELSKLEESPIQVKELLWGETKQIGKYELILAADCLFFEQYHSHLLSTLKEAMDKDSLAIFVNPKRGQSMERFLSNATQEGFKYNIWLLDNVIQDSQYQSYSRQVVQSQRYEPQQHQYHLIELTLQ